MPKKEYLRPKEAAKMIGVSPQTISKYAKEGVIPSKKIGSATLIHRDFYKSLPDTSENQNEKNKAYVYWPCYEKGYVDTHICLPEGFIPSKGDTLKVKHPETMETVCLTVIGVELDFSYDSSFDGVVIRCERMDFVPTKKKLPKEEDHQILTEGLYEEKACVGFNLAVERDNNGRIIRREFLKMEINSEHENINLTKCMVENHQDLKVYWIETGTYDCKVNMNPQDQGGALEERAKEGYMDFSCRKYAFTAKASEIIVLDFLTEE